MGQDSSKLEARMAFVYDETNWESYKNSPVSGRYQTELEEQTRMFIIDIARPSKNLNRELDYADEVSEMCLPQIDQIITNHDPDALDDPTNQTSIPVTKGMLLDPNSNVDTLSNAIK